MTEFSAVPAYTPTLEGFQVRLAAKMALHNFCIWLNQQLGRPLLAVAD